jgi:hypothetical protein
VPTSPAQSSPDPFEMQEPPAATHGLSEPGDGLSEPGDASEAAKSPPQPAGLNAKSNPTSEPKSRANRAGLLGWMEKRLSIGFL